MGASSIPRAQHISRDDHPVHLRWTVVDAERAGLAVEVLQRRVGRHAERPADLNGAVDDPVDGFGDEDLADRRLVADVLSALVLPGRLHDHQPRGVQLDLRVGDHPLHCLMIRKFFSESLANFCSRDSDLERALRHTEPPHAVRESRGREAHLGHLEAVADLAEDR